MAKTTHQNLSAGNCFEPPKYDKRFNFINVFLFEFEGFIQVNNSKQTFNRPVFTVHRLSIILKIPGVMLRRLSVRRTPL